VCVAFHILTLTCFTSVRLVRGLGCAHGQRHVQPLAGESRKSRTGGVDGGRHLAAQRLRPAAGSVGGCSHRGKLSITIDGVQLVLDQIMVRIWSAAHRAANPSMDV
jgi:hypothetical protein